MENRGYSMVQNTRRSERKTKKIDKNFLFYSFHPKLHTNPKHNSQYHKEIPPEAKRKAQKLIEMNENSNSPQIVQEMALAVIDQSQRLYQLLKIKLQFAQKQDNSIKQVPIAQLHHSLQEIDDKKCVEAYLLNQEESDSVNYWSCPQSPPQQLFLRKFESAKLLCDNYENHQLICTLQTLIPRPPCVNDLQKQFIDQLHPSS